MPSISLRLPDPLLEHTNTLAQLLNLSKTEYIKQALESYNCVSEKRLFELELAESVKELREQTQAALDLMDDSNGDGLHGH